MRTIEDYFTHVRRLIQGAPDVLAKRYEEQILSVTRGNLRIRPRFSDQPLLEISEAIVLMAGERRWLSYRTTTRIHRQTGFSATIMLPITRGLHSPGAQASQR